MSENVRRLFEGFQPEHYTIHLDPDRDTMRTTGSVTVRGKKVGRPSQRLIFHQHKLKITSARIIRHDRHGDQEIPVARINLHGKYDEVRLHADQMLYPGNYTVTMEFESAITRQMEGIYPCFFEHDGKQKKLIATQFESHHARDALPCIDEPEAKATFDLILTSPAGETALSNTPIKSQKPEGNKTITTFETTPRMSIYLLAFVYGELGYQEATTKHGVTVRSYATPDNAKHLAYATEFAAKCLDFYDDYFDIPYPLPKCDLVALPDFASGAMENWGLITFREQGLLFDPKNTSLPVKQYIAMVVAHELTHQWFGNLVTMRWWTDLWLNEGFATWMSYLPMDHFYPEWRVWTQFAVDEQQPALKADALANTHPIQVPIKNPDEIRTIFDTISYEKGASSIHMLHQFLGADAFRDGLRYYLKTHSYHNTDTIDLWDALEKISGKPVKEFMNTWTTLPGFPLVRADITPEHIRLTQEQFMINPLERAKRGDKGPVWPIALEDGALLPELWTKAEDIIPALPQNKPLKLNHGQSSFFRTVYNADHLEKLAQEVAAGTLEPLDRLGLLSDTFEAAKAGYCPTTAALRLLKAYREEHDTAVWDIIAANIGAIRSLMDDDHLRENMKPYIRGLVAPQLKRLGWQPVKDEIPFDTLLRPTILGLASIADEPSVIKEALRQFNAMQRPEDILPDLRGIVYTTAARHGDAKTFDKLLAMHNTTPSGEERVTLSAALTSFKQPELIKRALDMITSPDVRLQDVIYWVAYSFGNRYGRLATWEWLTAHWSWLQENLGNDLAFPRFPLYTARSFSDSAFLPKYKKFFESVMSNALERSYKQGVEVLEWQSDWKKRDLADIKAFFAPTK